MYDIEKLNNKLYLNSIKHLSKYNNFALIVIKNQSSKIIQDETNHLRSKSVHQIIVAIAR